MEYSAWIYGILGNNLILIPEEEALFLTNFRKAVATAHTWEDFITATSEEVFNNVIYDILEYLDFAALYPQYLAGEDLTNYVSDLELPRPNDLFSSELLPGYAENEYLPVPLQEMIAWIPQEWMDLIGEIQEDAALGFKYYINPEHELLVQQTFESKGFSLTRNDDLVKLASGINQ